MSGARAAARGRAGRLLGHARGRGERGRRGAQGPRCASPRGCRSRLPERATAAHEVGTVACSVRRGSRSGAGARVVGLAGEAGPIPRIVGVRTASGETVAGHLVVDALGHTFPAPAWLAELGARPPEIASSDAGLIYLAARTTRRVDQDGGAGAVFRSCQSPAVHFARACRRAAAPQNCRLLTGPRGRRNVSPCTSNRS